MRKHIAWYLKGMKNSNIVKNRINIIDTKDGMEEILYNYLLELNSLETN